MEAKKKLLTYAGLKALEDELENLKVVKRREIEQKKKYIPDLASGKKLGAFGLTEPGAGTDAQGQQTKAVLDGDEWVLNGSKCFITNGSYADVYIVIAVTGVVEKRGRKMKETWKIRY